MNNKLRQKILKELKEIKNLINEAAPVNDKSTILSNLLRQAVEARQRNGSVSQDFIKKIEQSALEIYEICRYPKPAQMNASMCEASIDSAGVWEGQIISLKNFVTGDTNHTSARKAEEYIQYIKNQISRPQKNSSQPPSVGPKPPTDPSSGETTGNFITCKDTGSVIKFQKWLKTTYKQNICADGKFGPKTFNAAKKWPNFVFKQQFQALKSDQRELGILCQLMSNGANDDKLWKNQDPTPEKCTARKSTPSPKPPTQPQTQQDVLRTLAASDAGWQQNVDPQKTNKFVSAYNQNQAFKNAVNDAAKKGILNTDWIYNNYKNYIREPGGMAESYNFYDKQKVDDANLLYEKLIKLYTDKEIL